MKKRGGLIVFVMMMVFLLAGCMTILTNGSISKWSDTARQHELRAYSQGAVVSADYYSRGQFAFGGNLVFSGGYAYLQGHRISKKPSGGDDRFKDIADFMMCVAITIDDGTARRDLDMPVF